MIGQNILKPTFSRIWSAQSVSFQKATVIDKKKHIKGLIVNMESILDKLAWGFCKFFSILPILMMFDELLITFFHFSVLNYGFRLFCSFERISSESILALEKFLGF